MSKTSYACRTDIGLVSDHNEDSNYADPDQGLWIVADGMGGHAAGEVASAIVVESVSTAFTKGTPLETAIGNAHKDIKRSAQEGRGATGMGSTVVALHMHGSEFEISWVGDSRAYLWNGKLEQLSHDHSFVQRLVDLGALNEAEARDHPNKNVITQSLGAVDIDEVEVGRRDGVLLRKQKILLCSDGLSDELTDSEIAKILEQAETDQLAVDRLVDQALNNGGHDNITAQLVSAPEDAPLSVDDYTRTQQLTKKSELPGPSTWLLALGAIVAISLVVIFLL